MTAANTSIAPRYGYLSGYERPISIGEQCRCLRSLMPGIGSANEKLAEQPWAKNAEGWFAILKWQKIAPTYGEALRMILELIKHTRNGAFYNRRRSQLGNNHLRLDQKTSEAYKKIYWQQPDHDILVVACQLGKLYAKYSVRQTRIIMKDFQFGLDPFAIACILLTHPKRLLQYDDLWIDCVGADYDDADGLWMYTPCFGCDKKEEGGRIWFDAEYSDNTDEFCGSASGFLVS